MELGGIRIYHAGDCDFFPEMKNIKAGVALLLIGGTYTMDEEEAASAAGDPEKFKAFVHSKNPNIYVVILDS